MPNKMFNEIIKQPDDYITEIIRLINSSFGMKNEKNSLYLWMTHRFNSKRDRYAIAIDSFTKKDFKISLPKLNNLINECFVDFNPDHVVFHHKEQKIKEGLIIDIKFIESLLSVETRQTTAFRRSEPKIIFSNFFDKLNLISQRNTLTKIDLTITNIEKKKSSSVKVDLINKKYLRIS